MSNLKPYAFAVLLVAVAMMVLLQTGNYVTVSTNYQLTTITMAFVENLQPVASVPLILGNVASCSNQTFTGNVNLLAHTAHRIFALTVGSFSMRF